MPEHSKLNQGKTPCTIKLFLLDGEPDGVILAEKSGWIGQALVCPRSEYLRVRSRQEFQRTGVYVLQGPSDAGDSPAIYIGETDQLRPRLDQHFAEKDEWTSLILFTSKDENLNKAHARYLEAHLIALAEEAKRCHLENSNAPKVPKLSEAESAEMQAFLREMLLMFPLLGLAAFEKVESSKPVLSGKVASAASDTATDAIVTLFLKGKDIEAKGYESSTGFVVMKDSSAVKEHVPSIHEHSHKKRQHLISQGILTISGDNYRLTQDYQFDSPSDAAAILLGESINGPKEWKDSQGRSLKQMRIDSVKGLSGT